MLFIRPCLILIVVTILKKHTCIKTPKKVPAIVAIEFVNSTDKNPLISTVYKYTSKRTIESSLGNHVNGIPKKYEIYPYSQHDIPPLRESHTNDLGEIRQEDFNDIFYDHPTSSATHLVPVILVRLSPDSMTYHEPHSDYQSHYNPHLNSPINSLNLQSLIANYISRYNIPAMMLVSHPAHYGPQPHQHQHQHQQQLPQILENYPADTHTKAYAYHQPAKYQEQSSQEYTESHQGGYTYILTPPEENSYENQNNNYENQNNNHNYQHGYSTNHQENGKPQQSSSHSYYYHY